MLLPAYSVVLNELGRRWIVRSGGCQEDSDGVAEVLMFLGAGRANRILLVWMRQSPITSLVGLFLLMVRPCIEVYPFEVDKPLAPGPAHRDLMMCSYCQLFPALKLR